MTDDQRQLIDRCAQFVKAQMSGDSSGHDWWHIWRVWQNAVMLCETETADRFVVELAALLHDIADWKFHDGDDSAGPKAARRWLEQQRVDEPVIRHICEIIADLSFKGAGVPTPMKTIEGAIVQDADRLDAIGAIGIARCFAFGGSRGRLMYDPNEPPELHGSFEDYKKKSGASLNHFYEKLFLLRDRMNTATARRIAAQRHDVMQSFVDQFLAEWNHTTAPRCR